MKARTKNAIRGAFDLQSIMVGIIVLGIAAGVIAATTLLVIPWAQDRGTKQVLSTIVTAEESYNQTYETYTGKDTLISSGLLQNTDKLKTVCISAGTLNDEEGHGRSFAAYAYSETGKVFFVSKTEGKTATAPAQLTEKASDGTAVPAKVTSLDQISSWCSDGAIESGEEALPAPTIQYTAGLNGNPSKIPYNQSISALAKCRYADTITYSVRNLSTGSWYGTQTLDTDKPYTFRANSYWPLTGDSAYTYTVQASCNYFSRTSAPAEVTASTVTIDNYNPTVQFTPSTPANLATLYPDKNSIAWTATTACPTGYTTQYRYTVSAAGVSGSKTSAWGAYLSVDPDATGWRDYFQPQATSTVKVESRCAATNYTSTKSASITRIFQIGVSAPGAVSKVSLNNSTGLLSWTAPTAPTCRAGGIIKYRLSVASASAAIPSTVTGWDTATSLNVYNLSVKTGDKVTANIEAICEYVVAGKTVQSPASTTPANFTIQPPTPTAPKVTLLPIETYGFTAAITAPSTVCSVGQPQYRLVRADNSSAVIANWTNLSSAQANIKFAEKAGITVSVKAELRCFVSSTLISNTSSATTSLIRVPAEPTNDSVAIKFTGNPAQSAITLTSAPGCPSGDGTTPVFRLVQTQLGGKSVNDTLYTGYWINNIKIPYTLGGASRVKLYEFCEGPSVSSPEREVASHSFDFSVAMPSDIKTAWTSNGGADKLGYATDVYVDTNLYRYQFFEKGAIAVMKGQVSGKATVVSLASRNGLAALGTLADNRLPTRITSEVLECGLTNNGCHIEVVSSTNLSEAAGLYWSASTGAHFVNGALNSKYKELGAEKSAYGYPTGDQENFDLAWYNVFEKGSLGFTKNSSNYLYAVGQRTAISTLKDKYNSIIAKDSNWVVTPGSAITGACGLVQSGCQLSYKPVAVGQAGIYWSPQTGAHYLAGALRIKYESIGGVASSIGYPTSDETNPKGFWYFYTTAGAIIVGGTNPSGEALNAEAKPAIAAIVALQSNFSSLQGITCNLLRNGCVQRFNDSYGGGIYWSPQTGAVYTWGGIGDKFDAQGELNSSLGYPITGEFKDSNNMIVQWYQGGSILWNASGGTVTTDKQPVGSFDTATAGKDAAGKATLRITGWVVDRSNIIAKPEVHIYVYNSAGTQVTAFNSTFGTNARSDVMNAYNLRSGTQGFDRTFTTADGLNLTPGTYTVKIYAIGKAPTNANVNPLIGTKTITVP